VKELLLSTVSPDSILADTPDGTPVSIDFEQLTNEHTLVAAKTGYGKSVLLRKILELALAASFPICVLDSDGSFFSLHEAAPNGILVAGGEHGDPGITIEETIRRLPQIVAARASVVFDIRGLANEQQAAIVARVLAVLMKLPENLQQPYLVVIDEVQRFAPQRGRSKALGAITHVATEGRKQSLNLLVASQRLPDVSKTLTSQMSNRLFGHVSDLADRKRVGQEIGISSHEAMLFSEFDKGDFLVRGKAFGGPLERVRIRKPLTGKLGKNEMIEKLRLPISPIDEVRALFGAGGASAPVKSDATSCTVDRQVTPTEVRSLAIQPLADVAPAEDEGSMEALLLEVLAPFGLRGLQKDSIALLAGTTERRSGFREALADLLARKLVSLRTGVRLGITVDGIASIAAEGGSMSTVERLARLRAKREPSDERVIACLSAAGNTPLTAAEIRARTGLGPRVLKTALQRLKRDCWIVERRGAFARSDALARLIGR